MDRKTLGQLGEQAAARFLSQSGFDILDRNWRTEQGEVDLIALQGNQVHFVEVRTRASAHFGTPEESITPAKAAKLMLGAQAYLEIHPEFTDDWRIDVIAVECDPSGSVTRLDYYPDAITDYLDGLE